MSAPATSAESNLNHLSQTVSTVVEPSNPAISTQDLASESQSQSQTEVSAQTTQQPPSHPERETTTSIESHLLLASVDNSFETSSIETNENNIEMTNASAELTGNFSGTSEVDINHPESSGDQDEDDLLLQSHLAMTSHSEENMTSHEDFSASSSFEPFVLQSEAQDVPQDWSSVGIDLQVEGVRGQDSPSRGEGLSQ